MTTNVTNATRRIAHLEARSRRAEVTRMVAYVAEAIGASPAAVVAEAEAILRETEEMTDRERNERLAADLGRTLADVEADLAAMAEDFARWKRDRDRDREQERTR